MFNFIPVSLDVVEGESPHPVGRTRAEDKTGKVETIGGYKPVNYILSLICSQIFSVLSSENTLCECVVVLSYGISYRFFQKNHVIMTQDPVYIEKDLDHPVDLGHAQDEVGVEAHPEGGRFFDIARLDVQDLRDGIDNDADLHLPAVIRHFNNNDTGSFRIVRFIQSEFQPQIYHGDHLPPEVDHPFDKSRGLRHRCNGHNADDLFYLQDADPVFFAGQ